jgi:hypothetical protein
MMAYQGLILILVESLEYLDLFLRVIPHLLLHVLLLLDDGWIASNWQNRLLLILILGLLTRRRGLSWDQLEASIVMQVVWVIVPDLLALHLLRHLISVLIVADVDSSMDEK